MLRVSLVLAALLGTALVPVANAQSYPARPVRVIVGFAPGGGTDILARALSQQLTESLGQSFQVDNRTGAGGMIAAELGARATPDGYTLLVGSLAAFAINPNLMSKIAYDPIKSFAPVGMFATLSYAVDVHPSLPVRSIKELIALARSKPGQLNFGTAGLGSSTQLAIEQFSLAAGVKMTHVPYKGNTPAMTALMSGEVAMVFDPVLSSLPLSKSGRVRVLAVTTAKRSALLPDVPTVDEAGLKGYSAGNWFGIFAPAGTPPAVVERLNNSINAAMNSQQMKDRLLSQGADPLSGTPQQLADLVRSELDKYGKIIKAAGIKVE
jgi:tripartite-type tricarboxylate transporter receptor subunit TctC